MFIFVLVVTCLFFLGGWDAILSTFNGEDRIIEAITSLGFMLWGIFLLV